MLCSLPPVEDPAYLNRHQHYADAGVYRISEEKALVQTVDFFTPVVDDPYLFGQIAAANSFSDLYAMGARPLTALNLVCFPAGKQPLKILEKILLGGFDKIREAGAVLIGGHSVEDDEPKYGLAVTGLVDPRRLITSAGARPGDQLILTKPLGSGIITTAIKGDQLTAGEAEETLQGMAALNAGAAAAAVETGVSAVTDITGFGLIGHLHELLTASGAGAAIDGAAVPLYPDTAAMAASGMIPGGAYRNRDYFQKWVRRTEEGPGGDERQIIFYDPQTSGGLLIAVSPERAPLLGAALKKKGVGNDCIGRIIADKPGMIALL